MLFFSSSSVILSVSNDLSLKRLQRIEILELILDTVEKCVRITVFSEHLIKVSLQYLCH